MRKKLLSLLLAVCMTLSLLPGTAYAAVGDLPTVPALTEMPSF